mgnify:CR=1 FL=1
MEKALKRTKNKENQMGISRPIRFRAWDKTFRIMIKVDVLEWNKFTFDDSVCYINGEKYKSQILEKITEYQTDSVTIKNVVIMQYTGLKDRNRKEIYEGDILKDSIGEILQIIWDQSECRFEALFRSSYGRKNWELKRHIKDIQFMEIIGNIYESKHLLDNIEA